MPRERAVRLVRTKTKEVIQVPASKAAGLLKSKDFKNYSDKMVRSAPKTKKKAPEKKTKKTRGKK